MGDASPAIRFRVLGPLGVERQGAPVEVNAPMQRRLLLRLLIDRNQVVSRDRLQDALWPDAETDKSSALAFHISKLRDLVDPDRTDLIATMGTGYMLRAGEDQTDAAQFARLVNKASAAVEDSPGSALTDLERALALWSGSAFSDAEFDDFARSEIERLEQMRVWALGLRMQALLALGRHEQAAVELDRLVRDHPLNENLRGLQMVALYRGGRQAEALRAYRAAQQVLGEELGIDPSPELAELEEKILIGERELLQAPSKAAPLINTVPSAVGEFIGRRAELAAVVDMVGDARLVTLVGQGGVGKTRLAQAVAAEAAQGFEAVWWVGLGDLSLDSGVAADVASAIGITEDMDSSPVESIVGGMAEQRSLLILDNCEQVVDGVRDLVVSLLARAPGVSILATSRRSLQATGETVYRLARLATPQLDASVEEVEVTPAVEFMLRSAGLRGMAIGSSDMIALGSITRHLEGLPLAIELAVARLASLSPAQLDQRLHRDATALGTAGPGERERRQTVLSTIEWSVSLLSESAQLLFARLGVFHGGADVEAIEAVCGDEPMPEGGIIAALEELVDASLVERSTGASRPRFSMLDSVATLSRDLLARNDPTGSTEAAHARHFARLSTAAYADLVGPDQIEALGRFGTDESNMRTALLWGWENDPDVAGAVALGLGRYLTRVGKFALARRTLGELVDTVELSPTGRTADLFGMLANLSILAGDLDRARAMVQRQKSMSAQADDFAAVVASHYVEANLLWAEGRTSESQTLLADALAEIGARTDAMAAYMTHDLGRRAVQLGRDNEIWPMIDDLDWWAERGHPAAFAFANEIRGANAFYSGELREAEGYFSEAVSTLREVGSRRHLAECLNWQAYTYMASRQWDKATTNALEAGELAEMTVTHGVRAQSLSIVGNALLRSGRVDTARRDLVNSVELALASHALIDLVWTTAFLAAYNAAVGDWDRAIVLYAAADGAGSEMGLAIPVTFHAYREEDLGKLKAVVGEKRFDELMRYGSSLQLGPDILDYVST